MVSAMDDFGYKLKQLKINYLAEVSTCSVIVQVGLVLNTPVVNAFFIYETRTFK
jgi:hypothetical protein